MTDGPSGLRTVVTIVQLVALAAVLAFVVLLFANEPSGTADAPDGAAAVVEVSPTPA